MKKSFFLLGVAVAAMTSCSNDKLLDQAEPIQKAIGFDSFVNKGTKATTPVTNEVTANNLNRFYVYGYHNGTPSVVFNNVSVIKAGNDWTMEKTNEKNWETKLYNFAAYADGPGEANYSSSSLKTSFANATLSFTDYSTTLNQNDLIAALYARDNSIVLNTTEVALDFEHLLSKVDFTFENTNDNDLLMVVENVKLTVKTVADCDYNATATVWKNFESETVYELHQPTNGTNDADLFGGDNDLKSTAKKFIIEQGETSNVSTEYFVIPNQSDATITYDVTFYDKAGNLVETKENQVLSLFPTIDQTKISWTPSYIYKYNVQLPASPKKIEFTVNTVGEWEQSVVSLDGKTATTNNPAQGA